jgi:hypothetical protein
MVVATVRCCGLVAVRMVAMAKLRDHPDSTVGLLTQGGRGYARFVLARH